MRENRKLTSKSRIITVYDMEIKDCEIFDLLDFCDFNTIKPFWVDDFGEEDKFNIYFKKKNFFFGGGALHYSISFSHAKHSHKLLIRMLIHMFSKSLSSLCV
jgi:hypothetical protein